MARVSDHGRQLIRHHEGVRRTPYRDWVGLWTVGVGHLIGTGTTLPLAWDRTFTDEEIDGILRTDLVRFERGVTRLCPVALTAGQFDALVSFSFNVGLGALQSSSLRKKLNRGEVSGAADEFLKWNKAGGKVWRGLTIRRQDERLLFCSTDRTDDTD